MRGKRFFAWCLLLVLSLGLGWAFLLWSGRVLLFWGCPWPWARVLRWLAAGLALAAVLWRPIPIKAAAVAVLYMLLFGLLSGGLLTGLGLLWPASATSFSAARDSGLPTLALTAAALTTAWFREKKTYITRYHISSQQPLPQGRLRIALLSDIHMGFAVDSRRLRETVARLNAEQPDLLIIAGDLVDDGTTYQELTAACAILGAARSRWGVYMVYGNHDLAEAGRRPPFSQAQLEAALAENHIQALDDSWLRLGDGQHDFILAGRHDASLLDTGNNRLPLPRLLAGRDESLPLLLVDHQPLELREAADNGALLLLSGHTHGGQLWPANWLSALLQPATPVYGSRRVGKMTVIVSSGLGTRGSRLRLGSRAEGVVVTVSNR